MPGDVSQELRGMNRRTLLRRGLLTGLGIATVVATSSALTGTARAGEGGMETGWRLCDFCEGSFYGPTDSNGVCPSPLADGGQHWCSASSDQYWVYWGEEGALVGGQGSWRWCTNCQGLFYGPNVTHSRCPHGGNHVIGSSYDYYLINGVASYSGYQDGWCWCGKCQGLYYKPDQSSSCCPAGGTHTPGGGSYDYGLNYGSI
jgi:hypothetical protein